MSKIFAAIGHGNLEEVKRMVNEDRKIVHVKDNTRWTPLDEAIGRGKLKIANYLWKMSGQPNLKNYRDGRWTSVHEAAYYGYIAILRWGFTENVLPLRTLNIKDHNGKTPLDVAIAEGNLEMAKFLFEKGGRPNLENYCDGKWTPVHEATRTGKTAILKWLFTEKILPLRVLNIKNKYELTPLDEAIACGKLETAAIFRRLLHLDPVFLAMQRAKRDYHQMCVLRRLPNELLDMVVEEVAAHHGLKVVWHK